MWLTVRAPIWEKPREQCPTKLAGLLDLKGEAEIGLDSVNSQPLQGKMSAALSMHFTGQACMFRSGSSPLAQGFRMDRYASRTPLAFVVEDEAIIALNLQDELQDAGCRVAGPFTTCSAALEWLRTATPDAAILDVALKDGSCREIALELARREVPFLIYSGYGEDRDLLEELHHVPWIEKPVPPSVLVRACQQLLVGSP